MASSNMSLRLLVDKKNQKVLFAEAPKDFVDFLVHIFSIPLDTLVQLLGSGKMVGCLGKLKDSLESFSQTYLQPGIDHDDLFNPKTDFDGNTLRLSYEDPVVDQSCEPTKIYMCSNSIRNKNESVTVVRNKLRKVNKSNGRLHKDQISSCNSNATLCDSYATLCADVVCPSCTNVMNVEMNVVMPMVEVSIEQNTNVGFVKEMTSYMVMDDLVVKPIHTISIITILNDFGVKDPSKLDEKIVSFGKDEALKLLKASLSTDHVLTTLFLRNTDA